VKSKTMLEKARDYIRYKHDLGFKYRSQTHLIESFAKYADINAKDRPLTTKLVLQWATTPSATKSYHTVRLRTISGFAKFLIISDPKTEIPPPGILGGYIQRTVPYIYSQEEIACLMTTSAYVKQRKINTLTFSTIIGLLSCTGMRIGEVLALNNEDIDWKQKTLIVRGSKKLPMRLVPIDRSTVNRLKQYAVSRDQAFPDQNNKAFFLSVRGTRLAYPTICITWANLRRKTKTGINEKRPPRLHDLRHTFACNHLLNAYKENKCIDTAVHLLSVYLGHLSIKMTYWYLTGIPQLLELISHRVEKNIYTKRNGK